MLAPRGTPAFNGFLQERLEALARKTEEALKGNLEALFLGGGYGRGEGSVVVRDGRELPYNDFDLTIVLKNKSQPSEKILLAVAEPFAHELHIEVDFSRPLDGDDIRHWPHTLMWYELAHGHQTLYGPPNLLKELAPSYIWALPPAVEATRLLLNRGAGLLWSLRILNGLDKATDVDFLRRNVFKALQAMGDAAMLWDGNYSVAYQGREVLLEKLYKKDPDWPLPLEDYRQAMVFKLAPDEAPTSAIDEPRLRQVCDLWIASFLRLESQRVRSPFPTTQAYHDDPFQRESSPGPRDMALNAVRNLRVGRWSLDHPRQNLYRTLPLLLEPGSDPAWPSKSQNFLNAWRRFN